MFNSAAALLENAYKIYKNNPALEDSKNIYTYEEYYLSAVSVGTALLKLVPRRAALFDPPKQIAVYLPKSAQCAICYMGVLESGNCYVPLDTDAPKNRTLKIIETLDPEFIITNLELRDKTINDLSVAKKKILVLEDLLLAEPAFDLTQKAVLKVCDTDPVYTMFTSGSTGFPKGVVIPHRGVLDYADWVAETFGFNSKTILGNQSQFYFDNSVLDIYGAMKSGAKLCIIPEKLFQMPDLLAEYINQKEINTIFWAPTAMIHMANSGTLGRVAMPKLEKILFCGEPMPNKQLNIWRKALPGAYYANLYGPTEITDVCLYYEVKKEFADSDILPIGVPCKNTKAIILNSENKEAAPGETGELCILGSGLALGYFAASDKTDAVFTQNPLNKNYRELIYRTGDIAYYNDDGDVVCLGRLDSQIKHRGVRIELGEIEAAAKSAPEAANACVLYDKEKQEIVLFFETVSDIGPKKILAELKKHIPVSMIPAKIIITDKLPQNRNGKIDRALLAERLKGETKGDAFGNS
jgi:amino acid adenylation domain-containing protein